MRDVGRDRYLMVVDENQSVVVPKQLRQHMQISSGDSIDFKLGKNGGIVAKKRDADSTNPYFAVLSDLCVLTIPGDLYGTISNGGKDVIPGDRLALTAIPGGSSITIERAKVECSICKRGEDTEGIEIYRVVDTNGFICDTCIDKVTVQFAKQ